MDPRDSDSSDDDSDYAETKVLLGYATKDATDDSFSQLGGHPTWLDSVTAPSADMAKCQVCHGLMSLLLQLNGDLPDRFPAYERRLYILTCRNKACRRKIGSMRAIRAIRPSDLAPTVQVKPPAPVEPVRSKPALDLGASIFGVAPRSTTPSSTQPPSADDTIKLTETFAAKASISLPAQPPKPARPSSEPWPAQSAFATPYPTYNLDAEFETLSAEPTTIPPQAQVDLDMDVDGDVDEVVNRNDSRNGKSNGDNEGMDPQSAFESSMDTCFQKFADRMAQNPDQVLRYEFGGHPLFYSKIDAVGALFHHQGPAPSHGSKVTVGSGSENGSGHASGFVSEGGKNGVDLAKRVPRCGNCGSLRTFECQLTPNAIMELEADDDIAADGMEWGTVLLFVCSKSCVPRYEGFEAGMVGYLDEWVGVQWEELVRR